MIDLWRKLRQFWTEQNEIQERLLLTNRPWEEEFTHWAHDGQHWHLHGHLAPPDDGRRHSVTSTRWCPRLRHQPSPHEESPLGSS